MTEFSLQNVRVKSNIENFSFDDAKRYIDYIFDHVDCAEMVDVILEVTECADGKVDVDYTLHGHKFERIRRVTGYLTGDLATWNDAKRAEERERVKHF